MVSSLQVGPNSVSDGHSWAFCPTGHKLPLQSKAEQANKKKLSASQSVKNRLGLGNEVVLPPAPLWHW